MALFGKVKEATGGAAGKVYRIAASNVSLFWVLAFVIASIDASIPFTKIGTGFGFTSTLSGMGIRLLLYGILLLFALLIVDIPWQWKVGIIAGQYVLPWLFNSYLVQNDNIWTKLGSFALVYGLTYCWLWLTGVIYNKGAASKFGLAFAVVLLAAFFILIAPTIVSSATIDNLQTQKLMTQANSGASEVFSGIISAPAKLAAAGKVLLFKQAGLQYESEVEQSQNKEATIEVDGTGIRTDASPPGSPSYKIYRDEITTLTIPIKVNPFTEPTGELHPFEVFNSYCKTNINTIPAEPASISAKQDFTARCLLSNKDVGYDTDKIEYHLLYNYETRATLVVYFIDKETSDSLKTKDKAGYAKDPLDVFKITDKNPAAKFTPGPAKLGIGTDPKYLIEVPPDTGRDIYAGISLEKTAVSGGGLLNLTKVVMQLPVGLVIDDQSQNPCGRYKFGTPTQSQGFNVYELQEPTTYSVEKDFISIQCKLKPTPETLLAQSKFAILFFRATVDYVYELKRDIPAEVLRSRKT